MCTRPQRSPYIHGVAAPEVLSNCFLNDFGVDNMSLFNFRKKKTVSQFDVRSHMTQDLSGDTRLF